MFNQNTGLIKTLISSNIPESWVFMKSLVSLLFYKLKKHAFFKAIPQCI